MHQYIETCIVKITCLWLHTQCLLAIIFLITYADCFCRVKSYISNGWATKYLVNPDECNAPPAASSSSTDLSFTGKWTNIKQAYSQPEQVPSFHDGHMISYFVSRTATDGLPAGDIKSVNKAAKIYMTVDTYRILKLVIQIQQFL